VTVLYFFQSVYFVKNYFLSLFALKAHETPTLHIFLPTTPNPTSGFLLMFPKEDLIYLDMSFEEASKFIVSAGTSNPKN